MASACCSRTEHADVFEVLVPNVLDDDLLVGLDLQMGVIHERELRAHANCVCVWLGY